MVILSRMLSHVFCSANFYDSWIYTVVMDSMAAFWNTIYGKYYMILFSVWARVFFCGTSRLSDIISFGTLPMAGSIVGRLLG